MHYTLSSSKIAWHAGVHVDFRALVLDTQKKLADALAMVNQVIDRRVTETGGSTTGDTFMFLIKAPLSRRRDRWRQLRYKLTREISYLPTLVSISLFCYLTPSHYSVCVCGCVWVRLCVYVCVCVCVCVHAFEPLHQQEDGGPNLLSTENEDCAVNGDPMAQVHKDLMANSPRFRSSSAVRRADRTTSARSIILEESAGFSYWTALA